MRYDEFINEGINDKGIFKAIFFAGLPGAGKSSVAARITDGAVSPRIVNTDKSFEFLTGKAGAEANSTTWELFGPQSKVMNNAMLFNYLNSMLPMFVDGTSANPGAAVRRSGLLDSLGYDTMMIWVDTDLDTAIARAETRDRKVDLDFIRQVYNSALSNRDFYRSKFGSSLIEVDNNADSFTAMESKVFNTANSFFTSPVQNPIGNRTMDQLKADGEKYLIPGIFSDDYIKKLVSIWYMS